MYIKDLLNAFKYSDLRHTSADIIKVKQRENIKDRLPKSYRISFLSEQQNTPPLGKTLFWSLSSLNSYRIGLSFITVYLL